MSAHYVILDDSPERIGRVRFLLHLRGIQALLAMNADEVLNWRRACRHSDAEMLGVILYDEEENRSHLQVLEREGFELPVFAISGRTREPVNTFGELHYFVGSIDEIMQKLPSHAACHESIPPLAFQANG